MTDSTRPSGLASERAQPTMVGTFLFADIRGYTRFTQEHGDEAAARLTSRFGALARESLEAREGRVISLQGDEAVAVFASARQALHAATELQARFAEEYLADPSLPLLVGIGLDTGEAVQVKDRYISGALNLAARLCKLAGPREVLASEGVVHVARKLDGIEYSERGFAQLKGFAEPVRVIQVIGSAKATQPEDEEGPAVSSSLAALPIGAFLGALPSSLLVAREQEMERLLAAVDAVASGRGRLVLLAGEPGVGKTRLAQEVMLSVRNRGFLVATGRCYELHQSVPFYPFLDALAAAYAAGPRTVRAAVPRRWPYLGRLLPDVKVEVATGLSGSQEEQQRLFRGVTGFLQAAAAEMPVAILLDDLQWADAASLELLQHIARHTRTDRILLLGTYRDIEVDRKHPLEAALRDLTREDLVERIAVRRLEPGGTSDLIATTLGERNVPPDFAQLVHQRTEGNPFFVQQLLRFMVERGDVYQEHGHWARRALAKIEVPESVRSVIGQRLGRLSQATQEVLNDSSVIGQTFTFSALAGLGQRAEAELEAALEEAGATGLIRETGADAYAFDHALTQQVLYAELPGRRKRKLHLAAAESLELLPEGSRLAKSAELAWHFLEAASEARALPYAIAAGDQAAGTFAPKEAERLYTTAIEIAEQVSDRASETQTLARRGRLLLNTFQGKGALRDYQRLLDQARQGGDRRQELDALLGLARASYVVALDETKLDMATACRQLYEDAYQLARQLKDKRSMVRALLGTRWFSDFWPEYVEKSAVNMQEALALSREIGDKDLIIDCELATWRLLPRNESQEMSESLAQRLGGRHDLHRLNDLYFSMMWQNYAWGTLERAVQVCQLGIKLADEIGVPPVQYPTIKALALLRLGRYGDAWDSLQHEVTDAEHALGQAMQTLGTGMYFLELVAYERAAKAFQSLVQQAIRLRRSWLRILGQELVARSLLRGGRLDAHALAEIESDLKKIPAELPAGVMAEIKLAEQKPGEAVSHADSAAATAKQRARMPDYVAALEVKARALLQLNRPTDAIQVADEALAIALEMAAVPTVWRLQEDRGRILISLGQKSAAQRAFGAASQAVQRLADSITDDTLKGQFLASPEVASIGRKHL